MNPDPVDLLQFNEFPTTHGNSGDHSQAAQININSPVRSMHNAGSSSDPLHDLVNDMTKSVNFLNSQDSAQQQQQQQNNEFSNDEQQNTGKQMYSFWSIEYYQQFFNVDTLMVIDRIVNSMIPKRAPPNYMKSHIGLNPDLYGPFWITVTLIFSIAISGNIASYLQHASDDYKWRYDFHLVSYAATALFIYTVIVPFVLWGLFKWSLKPIEDDLETESSGYTPSLLSLMCIYGYSLSIYIPVSILWVIQISYLQWLLLITAAFLSGSVLILILTPALRNSNLSLFLMIGISVVHFLLAAGFMSYFFHSPDDNSSPSSAVVDILTTKASVVKQVVNNLNNTKPHT